MRERRFDIFGRQIAVTGEAGAWSAFLLGPDGKRRPADFVIPGFVTGDELCQYLADLFHEHASPTNGDAREIG